jgi:hypothetical protein
LATSILTSLPQWLAGGTYDGDSGNDLRNSDITAGWLDTGILTGSSVGVRAGVTSGAALKVTAATGMNVTVGPGSFIVPNSASAVAGGYRATFTASGTLAVAASSTTFPRIDLVVAYVSDVGTSSSFGAVEIITGTAAASPVAPSAPANSVILAQVAVPANATSIVAGDISDERTFTATSGGIVIAPKTGTGALPGGYSGLAAYDPVSGSFYHRTSSGAKQLHVLPWAPAVAVVSSNQAIDFTSSGGFGSTTPLTSVNITTDGATDIKITYKVPGVEQPTPGACQIQFTIWIDETTQLDETDVACYSSDQANISHGGFTGVYTTSSIAGDTPSGGAHTIDFCAAARSPVAANAVASAGRLLVLRVEPVIL